MSTKIFKCLQCHNDCQFDGVMPFPPQQEYSYGVAWTCPACGRRALDVCNLGPLVPTPASCLNCGQDYADETEACPGCGLTRAQADDFLQLPTTVGYDAVTIAKHAFQLGLFQHGLALLNQLLQTDFGAVEAWIGKCSFYNNLGFLRSSQTMFEQALKRGAPSDLWFHYGSVLAQQHADSEAVGAFQHYLDTCPKDQKAVAIAYSEQGNALTRLKDFAPADKAHQRAIATLPTFAFLYLNYGDTFIKQRRWDDALRALDAGLNYVKSDDETAALLEAKTHVLAGQLRGEEGLACIERAMSFGANSTKTYYLHGRVLALLGKLEDARTAMSRVLELDPNNADAQQAIWQIDDALRG